MIQSRIIEPLSPPSSPRMSGQDYKPVTSGWQPQQEQHSGFSQPYPEGGSYSNSQEPGQSSQQINLQQGAGLRAYKTSPYPLSAQYHSQAVSGSSYPQQNAEEARAAPSGLSQQQSSTSAPQNFVQSVPGSPASRLSPQSQEEHYDVGEEDDADAVADEENEDGKPLSAAELRNQKRKMKRFRLTHNQTRFLMSEFARQAHPDAAHRERLSREIPGLSPRQVQVWFQNRRAKLKRLNAEDREKMMRSRALPENFDMTSSLHSPFAGPGGPGGMTPGASPANYSTMMHHPPHMRPLPLDTLRRPDHGGPSYVSPTNINNGLGPMGFTPPQSATDTISPVSSGPPGMTGFQFNQRVLESPRGPAYGRQNYPFSGHYAQQSPVTAHDRFRRTSGETNSSSLRSSVSYGSGLNTGSTQPPESRPAEAPSYMSPHESSREMPPPSGPTYGLGFSYNNTIGGYSQSMRPPHQSPATGAPSMELMHPYQRENHQIMGQQPGTEYQGYHNASYSASQVPSYNTFPSHAPAHGK